MKTYTREEVYAASLSYFQGDDLAAQTFFKYALQDKEGRFHENTPDQMHRRLAGEFARIENQFGGSRALSEDFIYDLLKNFKHIVPQGSPMMGIGNNFQQVSLSNCFAYDTKVITSDGTYSIGELARLTHIGYLDRNNIKLLTKGKKRSKSKWVPAEIKSFGDQKLRKLTLQRQGVKKSIFVTPGHRWFVSPKGRPYGKTGFSEVITDKLLPGDKLQYAFSQSMRELQLTKLSWFGIAHGIAYGDGECVRGNRNANSITLCGKKDEQLKKYFFTEGFSFCENTCAGGAYYKGGLPNFFKELPDISENRAYLLGWLAGYFAADGTCTATGNVRFNSSREEDLMLVKDVCNLFGIGTFEIKEQKSISNLTNKEHTMFTMHVMSQHLSEDFFILEHHRKNFEKADVSTFRYWNVVSVEETSTEEEVFCAVVPETHSFVLEDNILTGNCIVIDSPEDNMSSIMNAARDMANLYKRRYGVGVDISNLRPDGSAVNNSAKTSTGAWSFADLYSYVTRMVGQCIAEGQKVLTQRGLVEIQNIQEDEDSVWTKKGWVVVGKVLANGEKEVYRLTTKSGYSIEATSEHIFVKTNSAGLPFEEKFKDFKAGDLITLLPGTQNESNFVHLSSLRYIKDAYNNSNRLNENTRQPLFLKQDLSYVLGYAYGDGHIEKQKNGKNSGLALSCSNDFPSIKKLLEANVKKVFNYEVVKKKGDGDLEVYGIYSRVILDWMEQNGILKQKSEHIQIPSKLWESPASVKTAFLSGYFDADGYASGKKKGYVFSSVCESFLKDVQLMLMSLGIASKLRKEDRRRKKWRDLFSLYVVGKTAQERFIKLFGNKSVKVECCLHVSKRDCWLTPYKAAALGVSHSEYSYIPDSSQYVSAQAFEKLNIEKNGNFDNLLLQDEVLKIEKIGRKPTYDLMLPEEHIYFCQGFQVHNSGRRGALMITMDVRHPDIEKFITMKHDLSKVTGANVSIRLRDDFMQAVKNDTSYQLRWPVNSKNPKEWKIIQAKDLWDTISGSATKYGEPGLLFWDNILKYLPANCYPDFLTICVNPCGELLLSGKDSCRLISQNLKWYVKHPFTSKAVFDWDLFSSHVRDAQRLSDDLVELELERLRTLVEIAGTDDEKSLYQKLYNACAEGRRTGSGTHGLADCIARMRMRYDSDEAISFAEQIYKVRKEESYRESVEMAKERGAFPAFRWILEKDNAFIQGLSPELISDIAKYGRRNISLLTNAPTGSVAIESQTSSGIEPVFKNKYTRRKKKNHDEGPEDTDFVDSLGDRWKEFEVCHHNVQEFINLYKDCEAFPDYFVESDEISWEKRVEMQAAIQRHIDHSISSTINLPKDTKPEVVSDIYMKAWENGLKGVTVYVDESRSGVLVKKPGFTHTNAPKRPEVLECDIHHVTVKNEKWLVFVGLMEDKPYEVFGGLADNIEIPKDYKKGEIIKTTKFKHVPNRYDLQVNGFTIKNIVKQFDNPIYQVHTRLTSMALRHGIKPSFLVEQLLKDPDNDLSSFSKVLSRVIKRYILDGEVVTSEKMCKECGSEGLVYREGCISCKDCGWSRCS